MGLVQRAMTLGVRVLVRDQKGRVLLVRHTYVEGWHLPGGGVERGETLQQAASKEILEECNIETQDTLELFHIYRNTLTSRFDHVALFTCLSWHQKDEKLPDFEIAEIGFFAPDELPVGTTPSTINRLAELAGKRPVADIW